MDALELRIALARLNFNYTKLAYALQVSKTTAANWAQGKSRIPYTAEVAINRMLAEGDSDDGGSSIRA